MQGAGVSSNRAGSGLHLSLLVVILEASAPSALGIRWLDGFDPVRQRCFRLPSMLFYFSGFLAPK